MQIELGKTYKTRDGREVRIYATDGTGDYPVHGAVKSRGDGWFLECWTALGTRDYHRLHPLDLVEVKPRIKRTIWIGIYQGYSSHWTTKPTKPPADCLAVVKVEIDCEEGDGLEPCNEVKEQ